MKLSPVLVTTMLVAITTGCTQREEKSISPDEVFLTGREQAVVDSFARKTEAQAGEQYCSSLDQAFVALVSRAYPRPEPRRLAENAVACVCSEFQEETGGGIPASQRQKWVLAAERTSSFEGMLKEVEALDQKHGKRDRLINAGLRGMVGGMTRGSVWLLDAAEGAEIKRIGELRGTSSEPGILGLKLDRWPVVEVVDGMAAARVGVQSGDLVLTVNGEAVSHISAASEGTDLLRGPAGEKVRLTVRRGAETFTFEVRREPAAAAMIRGELVDPQVLYVRVPTFEGVGIAEKVRQVISERGGDRMPVVILDLRNNPGGRPEEANGVADIFLDSQLLQILVFRDGRHIAFKSTSGALDAEVIVLTNKNTGSGAEMVLLALRDNERATIIGEVTAGTLFGKDLQELENGQMIVFRTEPTILSSRGEDYSGRGVPPDIVVPDALTSGQDKILQRAIEVARNKRDQTAESSKP